MLAGAVLAAGALVDGRDGLDGRELLFAAKAKLFSAKINRNVIKRILFIVICYSSRWVLISSSKA